MISPCDLTLSFKKKKNKQFFDTSYKSFHFERCCSNAYSNYFIFGKNFIKYKIVVM